MGTTGDGSPSTPLLHEPVYTDSSGAFSVIENFTCPFPSAQLYIVATGGNPGLASGSNNPGAALMALVGTCDDIATFVNVNEVTTVASVSALAPFIGSYSQIGSGQNDIGMLNAAVTTANALVNFSNGTPSGPTLLPGQTIPVAKLLTLADILSICINTAGGAAGDGSACGSLFSDATSSTGIPPSQTIGAMLSIAQNPSLNVHSLFSLCPSAGPFAPTLTFQPVDWTLPISSVVDAPTLTPTPGSYDGPVTLILSSSGSSAQIHYTDDGSAPSAAAPLYTAPIAVSITSTIRAVTILNGTSSASVLGNYVVTPPVSIAITPGNVSLTASETEAFNATILNSSNTEVDWSLSAPLGAISASGLYSAPANLSRAQTITVTATSRADITKTASASVSLTVPVHVSLSPSSISLSASQAERFSAGLSGTTNKAVTWSINPSIGSISADGLYTPPPVLATTQNVTLIARSVADPSSSASASITIQPTAPTPQPTYYVDNQLGSDANNGTSPSTPFATLAKVNSLNLLPGQIVALKAGDEWHEELFITHSGTAAAPISFTSYGIGAQPIISAADLTATPWKNLSATVWSHEWKTDPKLPNMNGNFMTAVNSQSALVSERTFYWDGQSTIYAYAEADPSLQIEIPQRESAVTSTVYGEPNATGSSFISMSNLEFRGAQTYDVFCGGAVSNSVACANWIFEGDTFNAGYSNELYWLFAEDVTSPNLVIHNSVFKNGGASGIKLGNGGVMNALITYNQFFNLARIYNPAFTENNNADAVYGFSQDLGEYQSIVEVAFNTCNGAGVDSHIMYGGCFHPDTVLNWNLHDNVAENTIMPGLNIEKASGTTASFNSMINTGQYLYTAGLSVRAGEGISITDVDVENTTAYGGWWSCNLGVTQDAGLVTASVITFKKNICAGSASSTELYVDAGVTLSSSSFLSNNLGVAVNGFISFNGMGMSTYSALDDVLGYPTGNVQGNPQFVNPALEDCRLQPTSPALGLGAYPSPTSLFGTLP